MKDAWRAKAKQWGTYVTDDGATVTMERGRYNRVRFYDEAGEQHGPEHSNVAPAVVYTAYHGWYDPTAPAWLNAGCIIEVRADTRFKS
jgi:hypothetical protein